MSVMYTYRLIITNVYLEFRRDNIHDETVIRFNNNVNNFFFKTGKVCIRDLKY